MREPRAACRALAALLALMLTLVLAGQARASQSASLNVALRPERLGAGTTIVFAFQINSVRQQLPSPLTAIELRYPANIGLITSGLGLATCSATRLLERHGPDGCPADALMGRGTATVGLSFGPEVVYETGDITIWMAPIQDAHIALIFNAEAHTPILDQLVIPSEVLDAPAPYGGSLTTRIPPIETLPGSANGSIVQMRATLGPKNITYYEHRNGQRVPYHPDGIVLPNRCPHGGFPFAATFTFQDTTTTTARRRVPCPRRKP